MTRRILRKEDSTGQKLTLRSLVDGPSPSLGRMGEPSKPKTSTDLEVPSSPTMNVEIQWTVRPKVKLNPYQESMILKYLVAECCADAGWSFENYLRAFYLYDQLSGSGGPRQIRDPRTRLVCLLAYVCLKYIPVDGDLKCEPLIAFLQTDQFVSVNRRVLGSIIRWGGDNWLQVRAEPLELLLNRSGDSVRYSSYCKGYGEGGSLSAQTKRTRPSAELDGEDEDRPGIFDPYGQSFVIRLIQLLDELGEEMPLGIL